MKKQILFAVIALTGLCMTACGTGSSEPKESITAGSAAETVTETTALTDAAEHTTELTTVSEAAVRTTDSQTAAVQQTSAKKSSVSDFSAVAGEWVRGDSVYANNYLSIDAAGRFTVENVRGERFSGTVKSENGAYGLYKTDGSLWNSFTKKKGASGSGSLLCGKQNRDTDKVHFEDINENDCNIEDVTFVSCDVKTALRQLSGEWREPIGDGLDYHTLNVSEDGRFTYTTTDGKVTNGLVHITAEIHPDDSVGFWYSFCKKNGTYWEGVAVPGIPEDFYQISTGQDGARVLNRAQLREYEFDGQLYVPAGKTVTVRREPSDDAEAVSEVKTSVNDLCFFTCEKKGWYGVMLDKDKPEETFGFVRTENIRKYGN